MNYINSVCVTDETLNEAHISVSENSWLQINIIKGLKHPSQ